MELYTLTLTEAERDAAITAADVAHRIISGEARRRPRGSTDRAGLERHGAILRALMDRLLMAERRWAPQEREN